MTSKQAMWSVMAMLTIWCTWNSVKVNNMIEDHKNINQIVNNLVTEYQEEEKVETSWKESFDDAFANARAEQGKDGLFMWNGEYYTTNYYEESYSQAEYNVNGWVLNSDDIDDYCKSNYHDECGICDGNGATRWYADRDGDGLGDSTTFTSSCGEPLASK